MNISPIKLTGHTVELLPMIREHAPELWAIGQHKSIWNGLPYGQIDTQQKMLGWVEMLLLRQQNGTDLPFVVKLKATGKLVGATRYMEIAPQHRKLEVGGTWYAPEYQQTAVNTECKYLLLRYAFEQLRCIRLQMKASVTNAQSQKSIERLRLKKEGTLRNYMIGGDNMPRSAVYYSVLDNEWEEIKSYLETKLIAPIEEGYIAGIV